MPAWDGVNLAIAGFGLALIVAGVLGLWFGRSK